ncbi:homeobox protein engrailed-1-like [Rattus rattus]|uniref:homeobox protein engrailed-1-like n=1 Tax=Rattus rattus TaxID=10117 RepID=UPI0013F380C1|nr:homeobox protein engrailed-1-like [Rattus rattus]
MKTGGGEGGGGGGGGAAGIGMCPGAPRLVHSGPETPPVPGLPPPPSPPPTWLQPSAQAGPAGGREGAGRAERESVDVSCTVQRVTRVVPSRFESVCHPDPTVSSSTPSAEKGVTCQVRVLRCFLFSIRG